MKDPITFADYDKIEVRVGKIIAAEVPEGSAKLIKFSVDFGNETRTIFSGIKEWYAPEELVGVVTTWVTNIPPKKTPFGESEGMLFACDTANGAPYIVRIDDSALLGATFH